MSIFSTACYTRQRFGRALEWPAADDAPLWLFDTRAVFADGEALHVIEHEGRESGYRLLPDWGPRGVREVVARAAGYLGRQVQPSGLYHYGWFPCFDRPIPTYNTLRHASSTYALLEAWELTQAPAQLAAAERALDWLATQAIRTLPLPDGGTAAFLVDVGDEIKLGGNAVCLLAFSKHAQLTGSLAYRPLLDQLARGVLHMQQPDTGGFVHVLNYPQLSVKQAQRIIYYDGEAAFGLMRLYGLTRNPRYLAAVERAFDHFIAAEHWRAHDHWLGYCVNELTLYRPEARYFRFGLDNVRGHLDFVLERITTFPTLLELMCAAERMIVRLQADPTHAGLLQGFDLDKFHRALEHRARYLLSGHFWPELAMFFKNPARIVGSFFIRHHSWRVRIDDVEHYLSGLVAYLQYREGPPRLPRQGPVVAWGGDVNLGRRQHYLTERLGMARTLAPVRALARADLAIVNLECVVATGGERGVAKGEGGPYYFRARPAMLEVLTTAGVGLVATANNHAGDYGPSAVAEHLQWLARAGIAQAGSGRNADEALQPAFARAGPLTVALFAVDSTQPRFAARSDTPGCAWLPPDDPAAWTAALAPRIAQARTRADVVLVAVHWGANHRRRPSAAQQALGRAIIDAGADAVLGASAHRLQGLGVHQGRPIVYDAGDLLFDARRQDGGAGGVFELELGVQGVRRVVFVPVQVGFGQSVELQGEARIEAARRYVALCAELGTPLALREDGTAALELMPPARPAPSARSGPARPAPLPCDLHALRAPLPPPAGACVHQVPADARLPQPLALGPLRLLGLRMEPAAPLTQRQSPWVRSYWCCDAPVPQDFRLDLRAVPLADGAPAGREAWGRGMDHDPCDWLWPTSRWQPGAIYVDLCPLRPPPLGEIANGRLQLQVALVRDRERLHVHTLPHFVEVAIPGRPGAPTDAPHVPAPAAALSAS
ncbi:CapA family protein [Xenophilus sp. Marseille-Q4582]|uniref:CapA family protein n=1 Tax=Xenophilus sp. Marseille-Q4582 TaxID=2866600 RepID=UPI001CE445D2|nr:CapA family protein [Xenophilus sp. Marseille-Q4582]